MSVKPEDPPNPPPHPKNWKLNVQGVIVEFDEPIVIARDAMIRAGFPDVGDWTIYLVVAGEPKREIGPEAPIDLSGPGVEKIRLVEKKIDNGEAMGEPERRFALLPADHAFLNGLLLRWETVVESGRRWLLLHGYRLPAGYAQEQVTLAIEVPADYPAAQLDSFHAFPPLALATGSAIPASQLRASIRGVEYHGWSRHRPADAKWNPASDNVASHLVLVETAILREIGE